MKFIKLFEEFNSEIPEYIDCNSILKPTQNSDGDYISDNIEKIYNFYKWFGNSKFIDDKKRPIVCYHGTRHKFNTFKRSTSIFGTMGKGIYFTSIKKDAIRFMKRGDGDILLSVYLKGDNLAEISNPFAKKELPDNYDSIVGHKGKDGEEILVFEPNQIKSIDNDGSWDMDDDNIYS